MCACQVLQPHLCFRKTEGHYTTYRTDISYSSKIGMGPHYYTIIQQQFPLNIPYHLIKQLKSILLSTGHGLYRLTLKPCYLLIYCFLWGTHSRVSRHLFGLTSLMPIFDRQGKSVTRVFWRKLAPLLNSLTLLFTMLSLGANFLLIFHPTHTLPY